MIQMWVPDLNAVATEAVLRVCSTSYVFWGDFQRNCEKVFSTELQNFKDAFFVDLNTLLYSIQADQVLGMTFKMELEKKKVIKTRVTQVESFAQKSNSHLCDHSYWSVAKFSKTCHDNVVERTLPLLRIQRVEKLLKSAPARQAFRSHREFFLSSES